MRARKFLNANVAISNLNPNLIDTATPPIPEAEDWLLAYDGRFGPALNLSQAVPGDPPPSEFMAKIASSAGTTEATRYGDIFGDHGLRAAYAADCSELFQASIDPAEIAITAGCNQAFFVSIMALAAAGDAIILPAPWYFNHKMTLDMLGVEARPMPLLAENSFLPDVADTAKLIDDKVKAIVLVTPNNPTGAIYPPDLITSFFELAHEQGIKLILDETYRDFLHEKAAPHGLFSDPCWQDTVISLYSFSKSYAIPGHRLGAVTASPQVLSELGKVLDCIQICPARAAQLALPWAMANLSGWRMETNAQISERAGAFRKALTPHPAWRIDQMGAYFAYVRHPFPGVSAVAVAERLASDCGLLALPGSYFGPGQEQHLRFAFANVGCHAIAQVTDRLAGFHEASLEAARK
ncbi:aminotransferase [uncultured Roseibium sp.]|uniref:aminotransferase n=1 Tax=uncultured Roseibium sp. TaxID=1936171 RepID=UPI00260C6886|nr:aminotransferase [uncultured Roseibium sp.]